MNLDTWEAMEREESARPMTELPAYELVWRPDMTTRRSGWWSIRWATPLPRWFGWRMETSGYAWSRRSAEREVRRIVKRANRGLARNDWANA